MYTLVQSNIHVCTQPACADHSFSRGGSSSYTDFLVRLARNVLNSACCAALLVLLTALLPECSPLADSGAAELVPVESRKTCFTASAYTPFVFSLTAVGPTFTLKGAESLYPITVSRKLRFRASAASEHQAHINLCLGSNSVAHW